MPKPREIPLDQGDLRYCGKCDTLKPLTEFHRQVTGPNGHYRYCAPCSKEYRSGSKATQAVAVQEPTAPTKTNGLKPESILGLFVQQNGHAPGSLLDLLQAQLEFERETTRVLLDAVLQSAR